MADDDFADEREALAMMTADDVRNLDAVVGELGVADSHVTPAQAVRDLKAEIEKLESQAGSERDNANAWSATAIKLERERDEARAQLAASQTGGVGCCDSCDSYELERDEAEADRDTTAAQLLACREGLEIIAGKRQCLDNLMSNADVANSLLTDIIPAASAIVARIEARVKEECARIAYTKSTERIKHYEAIFRDPITTDRAKELNGAFAQGGAETAESIARAIRASAPAPEGE